MTATTVRILAALAGLAGVGAAAVAGFLVAFGSEGAAGTTTAPESATTVFSGPPAPRLAGTDPVSGERVALAAFRGRPVVLVVWSSWCAECAEQAPAVARLARRHDEAAVVGLDYEDTPAAARQAYDEWGWAHPSIADPDGAGAARLGLTDLPTTLFLDRRQRVVDRIVGRATYAQLEEGLEEAKRAR